MSNKLKELWDKIGSSDNDKVKSQKTTIFVVVVLVVVASAVFLFRLVNPVHHNSTPKKEVKVVGVMGSDFNDVDEKSALTAQQEDLDATRAILTSEKQARQEDKANYQKELKNIKKSLAEYQKEQSDKYQDYQSALEKAQNHQNGDFVDTDKKANKGDSAVSNISAPQETPITFDFQRVTYAEDQAKQFKKTWKNYVPSATYCRAVTLSGADAKAGVMSSSNTTPMMFKLEDCWLPDNHHISSLKNSHILASVYGDIGTERGVVRLESISFFDKKTGEAYDIPVDGTVSDISGRNGIKGVPVLRNKAVLASAGITGALSGIGSAASQLGTSQSIGGGGVTNTYDPSKVGYSAAGGALSKGADTLSNYYVKLAEAYSPVIEIRPGSVVNVIFQHGFPYRDKDAIKKYSEAMNLSRAQENQSKNPSTAQMLSGALAQGADMSNQKQTPDMNNPVAKEAMKSVQTQTALSNTQSTDNPFGS